MEKTDKELAIALVEKHRMFSLSTNTEVLSAKTTLKHSIELLESLHKPEYTTFLINGEQLDGYDILESLKNQLQELDNL